MRLVSIDGDDDWAVRDRALFELAYSSGLRLAELAGLDVESLRSNSKTIRGLAEPTHTQVVESLRLGINDAFRFAAALSAFGIITSLFMKSRPLRGTIRE